MSSIYDSSIWFGSNNDSPFVEWIKYQAINKEPIDIPAIITRENPVKAGLKGMEKSYIQYPYKVMIRIQSLIDANIDIEENKDQVVLKNKKGKLQKLTVNTIINKDPADDGVYLLGVN